MKVEELNLRKILDSRTNYTVEAEVNGSTAAAPSGASTGTHEAKCFVPEHLEEIEDLLANLEGQELNQMELDSKLHELDGTEDFSRLGAASIATSFAFKRASGFDYSNRFPLPLSNVIGGGEHGGNTDIQEFLVLPVEAESFPEAIDINRKIYQELKNRYSRKIQGINDEGALITSMDDEKTLRALKKVADEHGASVGVDMAASEFYEDGVYKMTTLGLEHEPEDHLDFVEYLIDEFELAFVEDAFDQEDFTMHAKLAKKYPDTLICGDDLFTTNQDRLKRGIEEGACNSLIVKPNQIGTVSDAEETTMIAKHHDYVPVISHRSGETCDSTISDLALEWECPIIKAGIADIRIAKLNQLLRMWDRMENPEISKF